MKLYAVEIVDGLANGQIVEVEIGDPLEIAHRGAYSRYIVVMAESVEDATRQALAYVDENGEPLWY